MERRRDMASQASQCGTRSFPRNAVVILGLCSTVHSFALANLFPYVGFMVKGLLHLESNNEAGYYAGYIASSYILGQVLSGYVWGYVSDRIGRKPVIVTGLSSIMVFSVVFGSSTTFTMAVISRVLLGLTNGVVTATRTFMRDVCGEEHVAVGVTYLGGAKSVALVLGAGAGGLLADPVRHYPRTFSATGLFARYPYLLPNLVGACLALVVLVLVVFCLKDVKNPMETPSEDTSATPEDAETYREQPQAVDMQRATNIFVPTSTETSVIGASRTFNRLLEEGTPVSDANDSQTEPSVCGANGVVFTPTIVVVLFLGCVVQMIIIGFDEAFPLWALSATDVGGLSWDTKQIGQVWVTAGVVIALLQLVLYPQITRSIGMLQLQRAGCLLGILAFIVFPNASLLSWNKKSLFAVCVASVVFVNSAFSAVDIALTVASTSIVPQRQHGQLNGMYSTAASFGRLIGPAGYATIFAYSISSSAREAPFVDFRLVFYASAALAAGLAFLSFCMLTSEYLTRPAEQADTSAGVFLSLPERLSSSSKDELAHAPLASERTLLTRYGPRWQRFTKGGLP